MKRLTAPLLLLISPVLLAEGDLTRKPEKLPDLVLGNYDDFFHMTHKRYDLETGKSYSLKIISSGMTEYVIHAPKFFESIFLRKVEAGGMEVKAQSLTELEFEVEAEAEIFFVPIKPGVFEFYSDGLQVRGMVGEFHIK